MICSECDNDTFEEGDDGFFYCQQCGVQTDNIIQTGDDDDDGVVLLTGLFFGIQPNAYNIYRPASKCMVDMLPRVTIVKKETCVICLEKWRKGDLATELPCKHKYHFECVKKWLEIHATCPQCRYEMPLESEKEVVKNIAYDNDDDDDDEHFSDCDFSYLDE